MKAMDTRSRRDSDTRPTVNGLVPELNEIFAGLLLFCYSKRRRV
jgi:hypothetical protein